MQFFDVFSFPFSFFKGKSKWENVICLKVGYVSKTIKWGNKKNQSIVQINNNIKIMHVF